MALSYRIQAWGCTNELNFIEYSYILYIYIYTYICTFNILLFAYDIFITVF